jgi:hypothetical protein
MPTGSQDARARSADSFGGACNEYETHVRFLLAMIGTIWLFVFDIATAYSHRRQSDLVASLDRGKEAQVTQ